ncbi:protein POOR HOMOLOGOUS SYNAPSIS 1 [Nymphaea colorata]|nr:protein POOR HOMOLOGOUS SYNAPSIS 1 [Nymphaea colorata]
MNQVLALVPTDDLRTRELGNGNRWHAQLAQLITVPPVVPVTLPVSPHLRATNRRSGRRTWLASSSSATLLLLQQQAGAVLVVSLKGNIHEEHYVSNLHFCWPKISCCRGSRLVFASYRDHTDEVQKFGLRFPTASDAHSFLISLKECLKVGIEVSNDYGGNSLLCENSCPTEFSVSTGPRYRAEEEPSFGSHVDAYHPHLSPLATEKPPCVSAPGNLNAVDDLESIFGALPPSFAALLNSYCSGSPTGLTPADSAKNVMEEMKCLEKPGLKSKIVDYMMDPSFQDVLHSVEQALDEMGGIYKP